MSDSLAINYLVLPFIGGFTVTFALQKLNEKHKFFPDVGSGKYVNAKSLRFVGGAVGVLVYNML